MILWTLLFLDLGPELGSFSSMESVENFRPLAESRRWLGKRCTSPGVEPRRDKSTPAGITCEWVVLRQSIFPVEPRLSCDTPGGRWRLCIWQLRDGDSRPDAVMVVVTVTFIPGTRWKLLDIPASLPRRLLGATLTFLNIWAKRSTSAEDIFSPHE